MNKYIDRMSVSVVRELGRGGSSIVYLVTEKGSGDLCAMKVLRDPPRGTQQLRAEAEALEALSGAHAGIPRFLGGIRDEDGGFAGFLMEYVEGEPLSMRIGEGRTCSVREAAEAGLQLCAILNCLHRREPPMIYSDLKPANILIREDGSLALVDYGAAGSTTAQNLGTEGYAAPEQYGGGPCGVQTDIYGIGAVLHHMLTGRSPLETGLSSLDAWRKETGRSCREMDKILRRCCMAASAMRFPSCRELEKALRGVLRTAQREEAEKQRGREEIRRRAWRQFERLCTAAVLLVICSALSWVMAEEAGLMISRRLVQEARREAEPEAKAALYGKAFSARPGADAFLSFLQDLTEDGVLTEREKKALESALYGGGLERLRRRSPSGFARFQMELGKALFACYEGGNDAARQAFYSALSVRGLQRSRRKTAEAMCAILSDEWSAERIQAFRLLVAEAVPTDPEGGDGLFAAAVCREAAEDIAFSAERYRLAGVSGETMREVIGGAEEFLGSAAGGTPQLPAETIRQLRIAVEAAKRSADGRN